MLLEAAIRTRRTSRPSRRTGRKTKSTLSLCGGDPTAGARPPRSVKAVPTALANGVPSWRSCRTETEVCRRSTRLSLRRFRIRIHISPLVGAPTLFMSVASLAGQSTLGTIFSDSNAYFAAQSQALFWAARRPGWSWASCEPPACRQATAFLQGTAKQARRKRRDRRPLWVCRFPFRSDDSPGSNGARPAVEPRFSSGKSGDITETIQRLVVARAAARA